MYKSRLYPRKMIKTTAWCGYKVIHGDTELIVVLVTEPSEKERNVMTPVPAPGGFPVVARYSTIISKVTSFVHLYYFAGPGGLVASGLDSVTMPMNKGTRQVTYCCIQKERRK